MWETELGGRECEGECDERRGGRQGEGKEEKTMGKMEENEQQQEEIRKKAIWSAEGLEIK